MNQPIYLDHAASTPLHREAWKQMEPYYFENYGNPSSIHQAGRKARHGITEARTLISKQLQVKESEIIFTGGGTEGNNLALFGIARGNKDKGNHIITSAIEHYAILSTCKQLEKEGFRVTYLPVNEEGRISMEDFKSALSDDTIFVTIMYGNNEVGVIQPLQEIGEILKDHQAYFHTDAVQAFGVLPIKPYELHLDAMTISGHKLGAPKGVGFLYLKEGISLTPQSYGGDQEKKRRAGTENVPSIVGLGEAIKLQATKRELEVEKYKQCKQTMLQLFQEEGLDFSVNGSLEHALPHVLHVAFPGARVDALLMNLDLAGVMVSSGSACTAGTIEASHVLKAMFGEGDPRLTSSIRVSFGWTTTEEEVKEAAKKIVQVVKRLLK